MRKAVIVIATVAAAIAAQQVLFPVLKSTVRIGEQPGGIFLVTTNQLLRPWGERTPIAGRPVDLAIDSRGHLIAALNTRSVLLFEAASSTPLAEVKTRSTSYAGIAFRPGDRELWISETERNGPDALAVIAIDESGKPGEAEHVSLKGHPVPTGIAFSKDGRTAYVAFSRSNTLAVVDAAKREVVREIEVGMAPFAVAVSSEHGKIFVTNRGGRRPAASDTTAPSSGSAIVTDPKTGASATGTLSVIDAETFAVREVAVGLAPSGLALSPDEKTLAVANGHSDSVSLLEAASLKRRDVAIPAYPEGVFGSQPIAAAWAPDGKALYVACGGNNAVAVLTASGKLAGAIPTSWFPSALAVARDGALRIVNIKGVGHTLGSNGAYNSRRYEGSLDKVPAPAPARASAGTREVRAASSPKFEPAGGVSNLESLGIRHVFFIVKENRTYDQVFGDIAKGNGEPKYTMYGRSITPNHHALAERYVLLDNFYTGGAISFDGHHWLMQAFVSDYVERAFAASPRGYAWNMADALTVAPTGFFWQGAPPQVGVRIYGEFCLPARWNPNTNSVDMNEGPVDWTGYWNAYKQGTWQTAVGCKPGVPALAPIMHARYPNNSTSIPDQIRAEEFLRDLAEREKSGQMPNIVVLTLNNDHTNGTRPGSPTPRAMVADDDLALGRIVEGLSKSRFWPHSLILVTEDDAQDGLDHVDGHRTIALAIGPNIRRGYVDSNHYNHSSMVRTIQDIFRIPPRTRTLKSARAMTSVFTPEQDLAPYQCLTPEVALDEMNPPLKALSGRKLLAARQSLAMNWAEPDDIPQQTLNRILWWDAKGYDTPYPRVLQRNADHR